MYFGSSADDQIHCLELNSGEKRWSYFTEGPVRFAPTLYERHLFVGSDDGYAYCLSTEGKLIWKKMLSPREYRIVGNNRMISAWPLRTGILVKDGVAYAGAGMFPKEGVHIVAFDPKNGTDRWRTIQTKWPFQGYLLLSENRVYVPTGRSNPIVYNRNNGKFFKDLSGSSDTFTLIKWNGKPLPNPRQNSRVLGVFGEGNGDSFATFTGNHMIVADGKSYLHANGELSVLDRMRYIKLERDYKAQAAKREQLGKTLAQLRKQESPEAPKVQQELIASGQALDEIQKGIDNCVLWKTPCNQSYAIILSGNMLFAGGDSEIVAYSANDGNKAWSAPVNGRALGIAVAHGRLLVSTDKGTIHCFKSK